MRHDEVWGRQTSDRGYVVSGIFSGRLQVPVKSGHAGEDRTSKVGSVSEAEVSFHRKTQSQLSGWESLEQKSKGCHQHFKYRSEDDSPPRATAIKICGLACTHPPTHDSLQ